MFYLQAKSIWGKIKNPTAVDPEARATTVLLQMSDLLFEKDLLPDQFTWSGRSPRGPRIAFKDFKGIIGLFKTVASRYVPDIEYAYVADLLYKKVLKHSKARSNRTQTRMSTGRIFVTTQKLAKAVKLATAEEKGDDQKGNESDKDGSDDDGSASGLGDGSVGGGSGREIDGDDQESDGGRSNRRKLSTSSDDNSETEMLSVRSKKMKKNK